MSELQQLRDRVAELEEALGVTMRFPHRLIKNKYRNRHAGDQLLGLLLRSAFVPYNTIYDVLYGARPEADQPDPKIISVVACGLRKVLREHGIEFKTDHAIGYFMDNANKAKCRALIEQMQSEAA